MRVLWLSDWAIPTGIAKVSEHLVKGLRSLGFEIAVASPYAGGAPFSLDGILIFPLFGFDRILFTRAVSMYNPDIVVTYITPWIHPFNQLSSLCRELGVKHMWYNPVEFDEISPAYVAPMIGANLIATPTRTGKEVLSRFIPEDFIEVVPHGVDRRIYRPMEPKPKPPEWKDYFVYGFVGKNQFRKDIPALIEAFAGLSPEVKERSILYLHTTKISTAGEVVHWPIDWLVAKHGLQGRVFVPEFVSMWQGEDEEGMARLYNSMDCYVHASWSEGFGLPILEAMACGVPVVASKNTSIPELVSDAGILVDCDPEPYYTREGWVLHKTSIRALREAMDEVFRNEELRATLRERGLERAREFTWKRACETMAEVLTKALRHYRLREDHVKKTVISRIRGE